MSSSGTSENAGQGSAVFHPHQVRRKVRGGLFKALKRTFRHRILLGLLCLISLGAGYQAARVLGTSFWIAKLDFKIQGQINPNFPQPFQKSILSLATHPSIVDRAIKKFDAGFTKREIRRNLSVEVGSASGLISVYLTSIDPDLGKTMLWSLNEALQDFQKQERKARAAQDNSPVAQLAKLEEEINKLRQAKQNRVKLAGGSDLAREMASIRDSIVSLENYLRDDRAKEVTAKEQYKELLKQLDELKRTAAREAEYESDDSAIADSVGDNRRRQQRIRELIHDEKEHVESTASLEAKLKERKEREDLGKKGKGLLPALVAQAFGPAELIRLDSEIHVLKAKLQANRKLIELDNEMMKIDKLIVPKKGKPMPISPIITQMLDKKMDRELTMLGLTQEIEHLQRELESQKTKLAHLQGLETQSNEWDKKIADLEKQRATLQSQATVADQNAVSIVPFGEPTTNPFPDSSNRPAIFTTVFLSGSGLSILAVLLYEWILGIRLPSDIAKSLRIPVRMIAANPAYAAADYRDLCRIVRSQGFLAKTLLQIQPLNPSADGSTKTTQFTNGLAAAFSQRGEKVLIIDLGHIAKGIDGLAELLRTPEQPIDRFVQSDAKNQVFRMIVGGEALTTAQLNDPSLRALLEKAAEIFQVILIQGAGLQALQQVEALGLATHGLLIVSDGNRKIEPIAREALLDLTAENLAPRALIVA